MLRPSRYNMLTQLSDEMSVLYNMRTGAAVELQGYRVADYRLFEAGASSDMEFLSALHMLNMAIDDSIDELSLIRRKYHKAIDETRRLTATIGLTESCNFRCNYCYQLHETTKHDEAIRRSLTEYLDGAATDSINALHINWFGGEPLLKLELLEELSKIASEFSSRNSWKFSQFITTNGSLLTHERASRLAAIGVQSYQITIDGPQSCHDKSRPHKNGGSTYHLVLAGVREALASGASVILRINLSRPVGNNIDTLLADLKTSGCTRANTTVHVVRALDHTSGTVDDFYLSNKEFAFEWISCLKKVKAAGFLIPHILPIPYNCSFDTGKTVFIDHNGKHGFCTSIPTTNTSSNNNGDVPITFFHKSEKGGKYGVIKRSDSFFESYCKSCKFLPACGGGCQYLEAAGQEKCSPEKYVFDDLIRLHYSL